jgi:outer membrane cobalamin receptor
MFPVWFVLFVAQGVAPDAPAPVGQGRFSETVVVTGAAEPTPRSEVGRAVTLITKEQAAHLPVHGIVDLLDLAPGVEVRSRGEHGVQSDFSLRGAAFGQTLVLIDGIRQNDSQTGHHNADIAVPLDDVERIEVLSGPGSSLYGADAVGGVIQLITRRDGPGLSGRLAAGGSGFLDGALSGRVTGKGLAASLTLGGQRSDGFTLDRDYRVLEGRGSLLVGSQTRFSLSHLDKEFGAKGFYGPAPSREWTSQTLLSAERTFTAGDHLAGNLRAYARDHDDHFVYDQRQPALSDNRHQSRSTGLTLTLHRELGSTGRVSLGSEAGADWVDSSTLGDHGYGRASLFLEVQERVAGVFIQPGLRFDAYGRFGSALSPALAVTGPLGSRLRWRASGGHAFRVPTFTELYYHDPNNLGNPELGPERAWGADAGLELVSRSPWALGITAFGRWDESVIDWVRPGPGVRWHTQNVRNVTTSGIETSARRRLGPASLGIRYAWLETRAQALELQSKYVSDFARHALNADLKLDLPWSLCLAETTGYRRKADGRAWWALDLRLSKALGRFSFYGEATNLLDASYQEIRGVDVPGRAFAVGVKASR